MEIREATRDDGREVAELFNYYVLGSATTFEIEPFAPKQMTELISNVKGNGFPFYVAEADGKIVGFYYINNWLLRRGFRTTVELVVYVHHEHLQQGVASALMQHMAEKVKADDSIHSVVSMVTMPSEDHGVGLLKKFGFAKAAEFTEIGRKFNEWQDKEVWMLRV